MVKQNFTTLHTNANTKLMQTSIIQISMDYRTNPTLENLTKKWESNIINLNQQNIVDLPKTT